MSYQLTKEDKKIVEEIKKHWPEGTLAHAAMKIIEKLTT